MPGKPITNPANIPTEMRARVKEVLRTMGPMVLGDRWPEGVDPDNITTQQEAVLFDLLTRHLWTEAIRQTAFQQAMEEVNTSQDDFFEDATPSAPNTPRP